MSANRRFGPFILDARIAVGGTAEVYLAHPATEASDLPQKLVVKRLLPHFAQDPEGRTMFHREARLHAAVTHENVVTVYHAGKDERGEPYLAMEYIDGVDGYRLLRKLRQEGEFLPVGVAIFIAREILRGLESVHAALYQRGDARRGIASCASCHGADGRGAGLGNPPLAGQPAAYLADQLDRWRSGRRYGDAQGVMTRVSQRVKPAEVRALAAYAAGLAGGSDRRESRAACPPARRADPRSGA